MDDQISLRLTLYIDQASQATNILPGKGTCTVLRNDQYQRYISISVLALAGIDLLTRDGHHDLVLLPFLEKIDGTETS